MHGTQIVAFWIFGSWWHDVLRRRGHLRMHDLEKRTTTWYNITLRPTPENCFRKGKENISYTTQTHLTLYMCATRVPMFDDLPLDLHCKRLRRHCFSDPQNTSHGQDSPGMGEVDNVLRQLVPRYKCPPLMGLRTNPPFHPRKRGVAWNDCTNVTRTCVKHRRQNEMSNIEIVSSCVAATYPPPPPRVTPTSRT